MEPYQTPYRWVMLFLLWLLYASFGLINRSLAPLVTPILRDLHMSYTEMGIILGSWQLTYILVSIAAGTLMDRWGIRKSLFAGALVMGLSVVLRYFPEGFTGMLLVVAWFGVGAPMISIGCPKTISLWFTGRRRGTAVGIYMTGSFMGQLAALTLTNSLVMPLTGYMWRSTFVCYGLFALAVAVVWWFLAKEVASPVTAENPGINETFRRLIRIRDVRIVLVMGLLSFVTLHGFNSWLPKLLETKGLSPTLAGFEASIPVAAGIPSLLVIPHVMPPHWRGRFVAFSAWLTILTLLTTVVASGILQMVGLVMYGIIISSFLPILSLILMDTPEVEPRFMGSAAGLFFCVAEIGGFAGPLIMGSLVDLTGAFLTGALFLAGLNLVIIGLAFSLRTHSISGTGA